MSSRPTLSLVESAVLQHLDAAYNLARWLMRNEQDARDIVQDSCMKALRAADAYRGGDFRCWFLAIVRNTCLTSIRRNRALGGDAVQHSLDESTEISADGNVYDPQQIALRAADAELVNRAIDALPDALRETLILREMEGLSYKEIGKIIDVPIGTVMSRLARGRAQLQSLLMQMDPSRQEDAR